MFWRRIESSLGGWKQQSRRKPLILRGARQVGKTTVVEQFSRGFEHYISLNLDDIRWRSFFEQEQPFKKLYESILFQHGVAKDASSTLIFIDEIQNSAKAIQSLRFFYEETPHLYVIAAGSLLESMLNLGEVRFPVGRVQYLFMYPMTFEEYLAAQENSGYLEAYRSIPLPEYAYLSLMEQFHQYTLLGGMPEVLLEYQETQDLSLLSPIYQSLVTTYTEDVAKYARTEKVSQILSHLLPIAPQEAGRVIKFTNFGNLKYSSRDIGEALRTLEKAMLLYLCYPSSETQPPIQVNFQKHPKLQFLDTGLLNYCAGLQSEYLTVHDLHSFYKGRLAEHIVGQELQAVDANRPSKNVYWTRMSNQSSAEVDFLWPFKNWIIPVEVKAGKTGTLRSLHLFMEEAPHAYAVRFYAGALREDEIRTPNGTKYQLLSIPYCMAGQIDNYLTWWLGLYSGG